MMRPGVPQAEGRLPEDAFPSRRLLIAAKLSTRLRGLLFSPASDDLMVLLPCHDIHTFGMAYAIDAAFVDARGVVVRAERDVLPNRRLREGGAVAVLERRAMPREIWLEPGDCISLGMYRRMVLPEEAAPAPAAPQN